MADLRPSLNIQYDSDSDMQVDDHPDYVKGPDADADGESVDDDPATTTVSPANSSTANATSVARLYISHSRPTSVRRFPLFIYLYSFFIKPLSFSPSIGRRGLCTCSPHCILHYI